MLAHRGTHVFVCACMSALLHVPKIMRARELLPATSGNAVRLQACMLTHLHAHARVHIHTNIHTCASANTPVSHRCDPRKYGCVGRCYSHKKCVSNSLSLTWRGRLKRGEIFFQAGARMWIKASAPSLSLHTQLATVLDPSQSGHHWHERP